MAFKLLTFLILILQTSLIKQKKTLVSNGINKNYAEKEWFKKNKYTQCERKLFLRFIELFLVKDEFYF